MDYQSNPWSNVPPGNTPPPNSHTAPPPPPGRQPRPPQGPGFFLHFAGGKELVFSLFAMIFSLLLCNFTLFGGFNLGFGIAAFAYILCSGIYLLSVGCRPTFYSITLLVLSLIIAAGFGRSDDGFMKFIMTAFLFVSVNLGLCHISGHAIYPAGSVRSIGDIFRTRFVLGYGQIGPSIGGLFGSMRGKVSLGKKIGAVLIGLLITMPVLGILLSLLVEADVAFEALMKILPDINLLEAFVTIAFGVGIFIFMYSRCVGLARHTRGTPVYSPRTRGINSLTINTVLCGICVVYLLYLLSQLAYIVSGFEGMVPPGYTLAEYARRGFFEMAVLCVLNMGFIVLASVLVRRNGLRVPVATRLLCLFIGLVTVFMALAASAKMGVYIGGYGLTRQRVMTLFLIVFLGVGALAVSVSMLMKKPRYMQVLVITALLLGATAFWVDVDTVVATYNVNAYLDGTLETVDVEYLGELSNGAIPQIARLVDDKDPEVAKEARDILARSEAQWEDLREWNWVKGKADESLSEYRGNFSEDD